jgi:hypothetical protein
MLQWGRDLSTAETPALQEEAQKCDAGFNGAAIFQPRKLHNVGCSEYEG